MDGILERICHTHCIILLNNYIAAHLLKMAVLILALMPEVAEQAANLSFGYQT